jgi:hypothetical protein
LRRGSASWKERVYIVYGGTIPRFHKHGQVDVIFRTSPRAASPPIASEEVDPKFRGRRTP